jgi:hypothetical protein
MPCDRLPGIKVGVADRGSRKRIAPAEQQQENQLRKTEAVVILCAHNAG